MYNASLRKTTIDVIVDTPPINVNKCHHEPSVRPT